MSCLVISTRPGSELSESLEQKDSMHGARLRSCLMWWKSPCSWYRNCRTSTVRNDAITEAKHTYSLSTYAKYSYMCNFHTLDTWTYTKTEDVLGIYMLSYVVDRWMDDCLHSARKAYQNLPCPSHPNSNNGNVLSSVMYCNHNITEQEFT